MPDRHQRFKRLYKPSCIKKKVAASTQNQAFNALIFFFRNVLKIEPGDLSHLQTQFRYASLSEWG